MEIKIGITGSDGFIGKYLADVLKRRKNIKLSYFDLPKNDLFNLASVERFVAGQDVIIHAAAVNRGKNFEIIAGSVAATYNLISAVKKSKTNKKTKVIFLSSTQSETDTIYGLSKKLAEIMLQDFSQEHRWPISILRLTNVFGEGCRPFYNSVVATFCFQVARGKNPVISNSQKKISLIYIKDVADIVLKEIFARRKTPFYFKRVDLNNKITVGNLAKLIKSFRLLKGPQKLKRRFYKDIYNTYESFRN